MHFQYFAETKLEHFYNYLVERTEQTTTKQTIKGGSLGSSLKGKSGLGSLLASLGLVNIDIEAEVSTSGKLEFSKEIVSSFTPEQKLKALLVKLKDDNKLYLLNNNSVQEALPPKYAYVQFECALQLDTKKRSEKQVKAKEQAVFTGQMSTYQVEIKANIHFMGETGWMRFDRPRDVSGFGTLIGVWPEESLLEIDPIIFSYPE